MSYGDRDKLVFKNFSGVDPQRSGLYPESFVPQELVERGLLLDARNCRFSRGRAYWHRNQLRLQMPVQVGTATTQVDITSAVRATNVVTCTTEYNHALLTGNIITVYGSGAFGIDGVFAITGTPAANTFTFAQTGADDSSGPMTTCWCRPDRPTLVLPFVSADYDQLLVLTELGNVYYANVDWSETPAQWAYGYGLFSAASWASAGVLKLGWWDTDTAAEAEEDVWAPLTGIGGFAEMANVLFMCSGVDPVWTYGMPTSYWDGTKMLAVGFQTPQAAPTGAADATGAGNRLVQGRYSFRGVVGDDRADSMPGPVLDVDVEYAAATAYVEPKTSTTPPTHLDTLTIDGIVYRFVDLTIVQAGGFTVLPYDVICGWSVDAALDAKVTYRVLRSAINTGQTEGTSGVSVFTPAHPTVSAAWASVGSRVTLTARATGTGGNSITLVESTADARIHISAAALAGGISECHIDLATIAADLVPRVNHRRLYRAFIASLEPGVRGTDYQLLCTIPDNTTTTYIDNTPQEELGEPAAFDHALPPRGNIMLQHRDRLWMAGISETSESYRQNRTIAASPTGAVRAANVVTITTTVAHELAVGDWVIIHLPVPSTFNGAFRVASVPSTTKFTYAQTGAGEGSGGGFLYYGIELSNLENVLFYSELGSPWYWPTENRISVGSSAPIMALVSWHDQLIVLKEDSAFLVTGYGEADWRVTPIPGAAGVVGMHVATSPHGVMWAGRSGWELFDGSTVRQVVSYREFAAWTYENEDMPPPVDATLTPSNIPYPMVCWHDGRFYIMDGARGYCTCWQPETDTWEIRRLGIGRIGLRSWNFGPEHSHILTMLKWHVPTGTGLYSQYVTMLDSSYFPDNAPAGNYGDAAGSSASAYYGEVRIELPPLVAEPGEMVNPLDVWVSGQWTVPEASADDLHLYVSVGKNVAWTDLGVVTQNKRMGIPAGYACPRLRLKLEGANVQYFVLQAVTVEYQRRTARGA